MSVITGEGRVSILYGHQPMAWAPHASGYVARPDAVDAHPAVAITAGGEAGPAVRTLARLIARHGVAAVVPPGTRQDLEATLHSFGAGWAEWSRSDRRGVIGLGEGAVWAADAAARHGVPLVLIEPGAIAVSPGVGGLAFTAGLPAPSGCRVVRYPGCDPGFWDDTAPGYREDAASDLQRRLVGFLDRHLG